MSRELVTTGGLVEEAALIRRRAKTKSKSYDDELDGSLNPKGKLWDEMRIWMYDCGRRTFPWHILWEDQNPRLIKEFFTNLRRKFPQPWKDMQPAKYITNVIRQARARSIRDIKKYGNRAEPGYGCQHRWWLELIELANHPEKRRYVSKTYLALGTRLSKKKFHRWGRGGESSFLKKFEKTFERNPTEFEIEKRKFEGWTSLLQWMRTSVEEEGKEGDDDTDRESDELDGQEGEREDTEGEGEEGGEGGAGGAVEEAEKGEEGEETEEG